jgi:hypothetical protein
VAFSLDGFRVFTIDSKGAPRIWNLSPADRPEEDWLTLARLWSSRRIDAVGGVIPLTAEEFAHAWQKLRQRYPQELSVTVEHAFAWHRREMADCLRERNPAAAVFHAWHAFPEFHFLWAALHP